MSFENIPQELKELKQWVCWQLVEREGKPTKLPINPRTGKLAQTNNPESWTDFSTACKAASSFSGIGFVFTASDPYLGIDMDGHVDEELIDYIGSYAETSQSGNGAHIICRAKLQGTGRRNGKLEIYSQGRYFCMTGKRIGNYELADAQDEIDTILTALFGKEKKPEQKPIASAPHFDCVLERIRASKQAAKFEELWAGGTGGKSASEGDCALLSMLRFWTGGNKAQSLELFRQSGRMREKCNRKDYLDRTWASIDSGEVWEDVAEKVLAEMDAEAHTLPKSIIQRDLSPWRKVTTADVQEAISGTMLAEMVDILRSPTNPPLPFEIGLAKALPIFGAFLAGENPDISPAVRAVNRGIDRARVVIDTAGGQSCNVWTILVAPSSSGKDIGNLADDLLKDAGLFLGTAGSEEGIADALAATGNGVMAISEMSNWLDQRHWQHKAASFLTYAWNKGFFSHAMSRRGKDAPPERTADYCYPSILASIQPETLRRLASRADMDSGFLGRFLMIEHSDAGWFPYPSASLDKRAALSKLKDMADCLMSTMGKIKPPCEKYQEQLVRLFLDHGAGIRPVVNRLCNEYLLRLALFLIVGDGGPLPRVFGEESIERAGIICQWLYGHAEALCGDIQDDREANEREAKLKRLLAVVHRLGGKDVSIGEISKAFGAGSSAKERRELVAELVDRGELVQAKRKNANNLEVVLFSARD